MVYGEDKKANAYSMVHAGGMMENMGAYSR